MKNLIAVFAPSGPNAQTQFTSRQFSSASPSQQLAETQGCFFINSEGAAFDHELDRATRRNLARLDNHFKNFWHTGAIRVGHTAFCEVVPNPTNTSPNANCAVSAEVISEDHSDFIFARGIKKATGSIDDYKKVEFFSCFCLFGSQALRAYSPEGEFIDLVHPKKKTHEQIGRFEHDPRPSFYELESAVRQTRFVASLAAALGPDKPYGLLLEFPREHYYFYLLDAWQQGLLSRDKLHEWIRLVDARHEHDVALQALHFNYWLKDAPNPPSSTVRVSTLKAIRSTILHAIEHDDHISPRQLVAELARASTIWRLAQEVFMPASFHQLQNFSYTVDMLTHCLRLRSDPAQLLVVVENHIEIKTFGEAQQVARHIIERHPEYRFDAIGFYPQEMAFTAKELGRSSLYWFDPGHNLCDKNGRPWLITDALSKLYRLPRTYRAIQTRL